MPKITLIVIASLLVAGIVGAIVFMAFAMFSMMGSGHMGMMGGSGSDPAKETPAVGVTEVRLESFAFAPANIVIDAGTTVTWTNYDSVAHTVTSAGGDDLKSGLFGKGETFRHTFDTPGEFRYYCEPHPNMKGLVTVLALEPA